MPGAATKRSEFLPALWAATRRRVFSDRWVYLVIILYMAAGILLLQATGNEKMMSYGIYVLNWARMFLFLMPLGAIAFDFSAVLLRFDRRRKLAFSRTYSVKRLAALAGGSVMMVGLMLFQGTFTSVKNTLPALNGGFPYDTLHADIDAWLHFGQDPWRLLYAVGAFAPLRAIVEFNYNVLWFVICFGSLYFVVTSPRADAIRRRYLMMFMFVWIVCGNLLAGLFLSAGPAFYGAVTGDNGRFAEQMAFLAGSEWSNSAVSYQNYLWGLYERGLTGFGGGISAFPSVHVGLIMMNALFVAQYSRRLGMATFAYVFFVQLSSVYLGWHYAIDGYVSIVVVLAAFFAMQALRGRQATSRGAMLVSSELRS